MYSEVERLAQILRQTRDQSLLPEKEFKDLHASFLVYDSEGRPWSVGLGSRRWNRVEGQSWVPGRPPQELYIEESIRNRIETLKGRLDIQFDSSGKDDRKRPAAQSRAARKQPRFVRIAQLLSAQDIGPVRTLYIGYIVDRYVRSELGNENILAIRYPDDYFEYVHFAYDEPGLVLVRSAFYAHEKLSAGDLGSRYFSDSATPSFHSFLENNERVNPEQSIHSYLNGDFKDLVILDCLPFSVEIKSSTGKNFTLFKKDATIPSQKQILVKRGTDRLEFVFKTRDREASASVSLGETITNERITCCIDANHQRSIVLPSGRSISF